MQKIKFQRGSVVTPAYLNESQNSISFDGTEREDYFSAPSPTEEQSWDIGTRDKLKDWEIDNSSDSTLGRLAYGGRVLGVTANTAEIVYGPPSTTTYNSIRDENGAFLGLDSNDPLLNSYGLIVESGSMVSPTGDAWAWAREYFIVSAGQTLYGIYHGLDQELKLVNDVPSRALPFSLLFRVTIDQAGSISEYVDLRPHTHLDNLFTYTQGVVNTPIIGSDYTASSWERILVDTRENSITITLPDNDAAADSEEIVIIDLFNTFSINPLTLRPSSTGTLENSTEDLVVSLSGAVIELFFYKNEVDDVMTWKHKSNISATLASISSALTSISEIRDHLGLS